MKVAEAMVAAPRNIVTNRTKILDDTMLDETALSFECCKQYRSSVLIQQIVVKSDLICLTFCESQKRPTQSSTQVCPCAAQRKLLHVHATNLNDLKA